MTFTYEGKSLTGEVITRIRDTRWLIESPQLPRECERYRGCRRVTLDRSEFTVAVAPKPAPSIPRARTPLERMVDRACGLE